MPQDASVLLTIIPVFTLLLLYIILHNTRIAKACESQIVPSHSLLFPSDDL